MISYTSNIIRNLALHCKKTVNCFTSERNHKSTMAQILSQAYSHALTAGAGRNRLERQKARFREALVKPIPVPGGDPTRPWLVDMMTKRIHVHYKNLVSEELERFQKEFEVELGGFAKDLKDFGESTRSRAPQFRTVVEQLRELLPNLKERQRILEERYAPVASDQDHTESDGEIPLAKAQDRSESRVDETVPGPIPSPPPARHHTATHLPSPSQIPRD